MPGPLTIDSRVAAAPDQLSTQLSGETVILALQSGQYFGLDPVGTYIWEFLREPRRVHEVVAHVVSRYDVSDEQCTRDVLALMGELASHGLVTIEE
ncbi:MAG TPA: PqqD family protein [Gemmatimonadaceae bacterium]|nr:PqqD family protein [Gemmatimonadaceae bacterium]